MRLPIFRRGDFRQPPPLRNNLFYHFEHKIIDINVKNTIRDSAGRRAAIFLFSGPRFALQNRVHWFSGLAGANPAGGRAAIVFFSGPRFALRNRVHWLSGLAGANPAGGRAAIVFFSGPQFALRNRVHWLCGQAGANPSAGRAGFFLFSGPRFALQNRVHWFCGLAGANRAGGPGTNKKGACAGASSPHLKIPIKYPHSITCFWISG